MLQVEGLVKTYRDFVAVAGVSFTVSPGEIVGLLGPNGAGKTTTMRCIAGILRATGGRILINGHDLVADQRRAKLGLAFVPEVPSLYELLTVREHLKFVAMCFDRVDEYNKHGSELLRRYDLDEKADSFVATLSKGMKQKLAVACASVHDANVWLLDEPLIGVDPRGAHEFRSELTRMRSEGKCILISTHLLDTAQKLCDRVIILSRGKKMAEGTVEELRKQADLQGATLEDIFLKLTDEEEVSFDLSPQ
jgi:ABC-2 type transport system ATP-binding protein